MRRATALAVAAIVVAGCGGDTTAPPRPAATAAAVKAAGGLIVFRATVDGYTQLFTVRPDGSDQRQITHAEVPAQGDNAGPEQPEFSPDGRRIAFDASPKPDRVDLYTAAPDGSGIQKVPLDVGEFNGNPSYSPDGRRFVFDQDVGPDEPLVHGLYVAGVDGSHARRLTTGPRTDEAYDGSGDWSPDGRRIVFQRVLDEARTAIFVVDADGRRERRLTAWTNGSSNPHWSRDGKTILFHTYTEPTPGKSANLFTMRPDGSHKTQLTHFKGGFVNAFGPNWSPDGSQIVWHRQGAEIDDLYIMDAAGGPSRRITHTELGMEPGGADWTAGS